MRPEINLIKAISNKDTSQVKRILSTAIDGAKNSMAPLMCACEQEDIEIIKCLLNAGADINKQDSNGQTTLHMAVDIAIDGAIQPRGKMWEEPINVADWECMD